MKRKLVTLFLALCCLFSLGTLTACFRNQDNSSTPQSESFVSMGGNENSSPVESSADDSSSTDSEDSSVHIHEYGAWVKNPDTDTHTKSCSCGDTITEKCSGGTANCLEQATCSVCHEKYGDFNLDNHTSNGFVYTANNNGTHTKKYECCNSVASIDNCSGGTATCLEKAACSICNVKYGTVNTGNHATPNSYTYTNLGENGHSKTYACCNHVSVENETHTFVNNQCNHCGFIQEGLAYTLNDDNQSYSVTGIGTCKDTEIIIPSTYNNLPVTSIGRSAFRFCNSLTSVTISNGVTSIEDNVFSGCSRLKEIIIPDSVTSINSYTFSGCSGLTNITVGGNNINYQSIDGNLYSKDGTTLIQYAVGKTATTFTILDNVTSIGDRAFYACGSLTNVTIGNGVTSIGESAFMYCYNLTNVTIGDNVTSISWNAFYECSMLIQIENGIQYVDKWVIDCDDTITSAIFQSGTKGIADSAFDACAITKITIPDSVTSIGYRAFANCYNLTSVTIGNGVSSIVNETFFCCNNLKNITLPDSITSIGESAFYSCQSLTKINIPANVTYIGSSAFISCSGLTEITIPDSVTSIGDRAFYGCSGLTNVTIGNGVTSIGDNAFIFLDSLTSITISNNYVLNYFPFYNYYNLKYVTIGNNVTSIEEDTFDSCSLTSVIFVDNSQLVSIGDNAFSRCNSLTKITIPNSVTSIGAYAFWACPSLTEIIIPDSVTSIGRNVFANCSSLTSVTVGNSVTTIGAGAFSWCNSLTSVTFKNTSGWSADDTTISSVALANTSTAATYLKSTYTMYNWTRSDE